MIILLYSIVGGVIFCDNVGCMSRGKILVQLWVRTVLARDTGRNGIDGKEAIRGAYA